MAVTLQAQFDWYYAALSLSKARPPPLKKRLQEHMLNCDPSIYVHHVALLSSGSNHISTVSFYPLSICPFWRDLTVKQKVSPASGLFLWRSSPPLINPLCPFVAHPTHQPSRQAQSDLTFVFFCWPEGMLSSWTKFASLLFISLVADCSCFWVTHYWIVLALWIWMCMLGRTPGCSVHCNLWRMHHLLSTEYISVFISLLWASQNNAASVSQQCKVVCGASRCLLTWSQGSLVEILFWYPSTSYCFEDVVSRSQAGQTERALKITF